MERLLTDRWRVSQREEHDAVSEILKTMEETHRRKGALYGTSWRQWGLIGAFMNLFRKTDRAREIFWSLIGGEFPEEVEDTLLDLAVYAVLVLCYIRGTRNDHGQDAI